MIPSGFEPETYCLEGSCSIQLSYGTCYILRLQICSILPVSTSATERLFWCGVECAYYLCYSVLFMNITVTQLYIYPVKSLGGIALQEAELTSRGLNHDRRWMLIDEENQFLSQRKYPQMALFQLSVHDTGILVKHLPTNEEITIPLEPLGKDMVEVTVWDNACTGTYVSTALDDWFTDKLRLKCRLIYMADDSVRPVDERYAGDGHITSFADGYPMLLTSEASLQDLNSRIADPVEMLRFRPNIVISGTEPYFEDQMHHFELSGISMSGVKPCARCVMIGVDPRTATSEPEPLRTLARYRRVRNKILFGQNLVHHGTGVIRVGDTVQVKELVPPLAFDL